MKISATTIPAGGRPALTSERFAALLTAAKAAVIEARTGRRDPLAPILEALRELDEMPAPGARLSDVLTEAAAAWPKAVAL